MSAHSPRQAELGGRRAVVTGSSSGIGRAIALELAHAGADLVVHCHRSRRGAEETAELAGKLGVRATVVCADLSKEAGCSGLVDAAWNALGDCNIWVNNAGADTLTGDAARLAFHEKLELLWAVDV